MENPYSTSPDGERFPLPREEDYQAEFQRLQALAETERARGREIVVVMGLGFVGLVMAAVVADAEDEQGKSSRFVIGMQRPSDRSYWKIPLINRGISPVVSEDPLVEELVRRCVTERKNLIATYTYDVLRLADVVVVDVQCDYVKEALGNVRQGDVDMKALENAFHSIGERIPAHALVLIETTVPPGTTEQIAYPIMLKEFRNRGIDSTPLLAHSYERVMPGRQYVDSVRNFWRVCSGINDQAKERVQAFLNDVLNTREFPLTVLDRPVESETAKIVENSYRATMLAFMDEWSTFSERNGVDIVKVIDAIQKRPTHSNLLFPGPGIGGYCLPKDGGLGHWAYNHIFGFQDDILKITPTAIDINDTRPLHVAELTRDALRNMNRPLAAADVLILGVSYREDIGDTRYSGSELLVRRLAEMGAELRVHDPYVKHWWEIERQETYPRPGYSLARFFRNQDKLQRMRMAGDLQTAFRGVDAVLFAVRHRSYLELEPNDVVKWAGGPLAVIDCFGILDDAKIRRYFELDCEVKGLGRGHVKRIKDAVRAEKWKKHSGS
jgi:UDP-N-acetyl-D-glucosamine dehydrogenase